MPERNHPTVNDLAALLGEASPGAALAGMAASALFGYLTDAAACEKSLAAAQAAYTAAAAAARQDPEGSTADARKQWAELAEAADPTCQEIQASIRDFRIRRDRAQAGAAAVRNMVRVIQAMPPAPAPVPVQVQDWATRYTADGIIPSDPVPQAMIHLWAAADALALAADDHPARPIVGYIRALADDLARIWNMDLGMGEPAPADSLAARVQEAGIAITADPEPVRTVVIGDDGRLMEAVWPVCSYCGHPKADHPVCQVSGCDCYAYDPNPRTPADPADCQGQDVPEAGPVEIQEFMGALGEHLAATDPDYVAAAGQAVQDVQAAAGSAGGPSDE